jgi:glycine cleavage system H protein
MLLNNSPEMLNADPHGEAWLVRIRLLDRSEIEKLMTADEYEAFLQEEKAH